ncbi:hypothetical protein J3458_009248 [Metarhizium acridum]|uniref:uncharacterized protein n=1 Tax=Metarhizium acridum TaxID=92637 RepID=UPI001C6AA8A0|nr:hypothetical protein J3458_009248 [Metarhizium acridum]
MVEKKEKEANKWEPRLETPSTPYPCFLFFIFSSDNQPLSPPSSHQTLPDFLPDIIRVLVLVKSQILPNHDSVSPSKLCDRSCFIVDIAESNGSRDRPPGGGLRDPDPITMSCF